MHSRSLVFITYLLALRAAATCVSGEDACDEPASMKVSMLQKMKKQTNEHTHQDDIINTLAARKSEILHELQDLSVEIDAVHEEEGNGEGGFNPGSQCEESSIDRRRRDAQMCSCRRRDGPSSTGKFACEGNTMVVYSDPPRRRSYSPPRRRWDPPRRRSYSPPRRRSYSPPRRRSPAGSSTVQIRYSPASDYCLSVDNDDPSNGVKMHLWQCQGGVGQYFEAGIDVTVPSNIRLKMSPDKCVVVDSNSANNGQQVQVWSCDNSYSQMWSKIDGESGYRGRWDGRLRFNKDQNYCMVVDGNNAYNGAKVQLWRCSDGDQYQKTWTVLPQREPE